jgi:hypothetical protein
MKLNLNLYTTSLYIIYSDLIIGPFHCLKNRLPFNVLNLNSITELNQV